MRKPEVLPFGYRISRLRNRVFPPPKRWIRNLHAFLVGNTDLHGLVRCPSLACRWRKSAPWICDLGCGRGDFHLETLLRSPSEGNVVGVDVDLEALRHAFRLAQAGGLRGKVHYVCASADALPFRDGVFDQLFLVDVLEHVPDDRSALSESSRVLRNRGRLELSTPTLLYPIIFGRKTHKGVGHVRPGYRPEDLKSALRRAGFDAVMLRGNTGLLTWPWMALWYRLAWLTLWNPRRRFILIRMAAHGVLVAACLGARLTRRLDGFGGYCSNDVEARKTDA